MSNFIESELVPAAVKNYITRDKRHRNIRFNKFKKY